MTDASGGPGPAGDAPGRAALPGQVVLVLQGGGALGAYHVGVYQALHESGIEPDWVIGTSIGAINAWLIAANPLDRRMAMLNEFWQQMESAANPAPGLDWFGMGQFAANLATLSRGIPGFFRPNLHALRGVGAALGVESASYYCTLPLRDTLTRLAALSDLAQSPMRATVGAVNVRTGLMRYFDSRRDSIDVSHVLASGALPPAFGAVLIDGDPYWDGGIYSNTPIEAVLDDHPRRSSLIFAVNVWHQEGAEPESIWQVLGRQKDIQYASRAHSHLAQQRKIHRLRHVIRELQQHMPAELQADPRVAELAAWGCGTTMHVAHLVAPRLDGEDHTKDIDFTAAGIRARRAAGYSDTMRMIGCAPWHGAADPIEGIVEHF